MIDLSFPSEKRCVKPLMSSVIIRNLIIKKAVPDVVGSNDASFNGVLYRVRQENAIRTFEALS